MGRRLSRARRSEMEREGIQEQIHTRFVVRREVDSRGFAAAGALHRHLRRLQLNIVFLGFVDDGVTEVLVGVGSFEADAGGDLRRDVTHVGLQFEIGDLTGSDLPARGDSQA